MSRENKRQERIVKEPTTQPSLAVSPLLPQMGSNQNFLKDGFIDERKFAILPSLGVGMALYHLHHRGVIDKIRYFAGLEDYILVTSQAVEGTARKHVILLTEAESGRGKPDFAKRPNWIARNTYRRNWEEKAKEDGKVIIQ